MTLYFFYGPLVGTCGTIRLAISLMFDGAGFVNLFVSLDLLAHDIRKQDFANAMMKLRAS
jgi:hypothetical protein